jgi:hypothetical protein
MRGPPDAASSTPTCRASAGKLFGASPRMEGASPLITEASKAAAFMPSAMAEPSSRSCAFRAAMRA